MGDGRDREKGAELPANGGSAEGEGGVGGAVKRNAVMTESAEARTPAPGSGEPEVAPGAFGKPAAAGEGAEPGTVAAEGAEPGTDTAEGAVTKGPAGKEPLVRLEALSRHFGAGEERLDVLREIDFDIASGDSVAVVGASGIGKSTLLHIMGTLDRPDGGRLLFGGEDLFALGDEKLAAFRNRKIGFVFQFHHLLQEFSALENVMMPVLVSGGSRKEARDAAERILTRVGLAGRFRHLVGELSGGQQQRVALARALVMEPELLLADEPTGNLDEKNSRQIHELLAELNRETGMTLVVVTHNMELAAMMKRCVTLSEGSLRGAGDETANG